MNTGHRGHLPDGRLLALWPPTRAAATWPLGCWPPWAGAADGRAQYGWIAIFLKQQQIVTGVAINILALGICAFLPARHLWRPRDAADGRAAAAHRHPLLPRYRLSVRSFDQNILTYLLFILVPLASFVLYRTSSFFHPPVGENPERATLPASGSIGCAS